MGRTDRSSIVIPASRGRVYAALLDASALETWLPPSNMQGRVLELDPRPGGRFRMELTYLDGSRGKSSEHTGITEGTFVELAPNERIVQNVVFHSDEPSFAGVRARPSRGRAGTSTDRQRERGER